MRPTWTKLLALLLGLTLVAAACGDSDSDDGDADTEATEAAGDDGGDADTGVLEFRALDAGGPITKEALSAGDIDVALLFTSDADIAVNGWVLLDDDQGLQQIENLTPAIRTEVLTPEIETVLDAVSAPLTTAELTELNRQSTQDLIDADEIAATWLESQGIIPWAGDPVDGSIRVGSTNFFEQEIVAELYAGALESAGMTVSRTFQLGAREVVAPALESGEIDLYPEYLGTYSVFAGAESVPSDAAEAADQLRGLLEDRGVTVLTPAPAEDRNGLVVTQETADTYGLSATSDLAGVTDVLTFGGPPECPDRDFCLIGLTEVYGLTFQE
ncbi:MAG: glycine betaine ABC transporter substrate-binding protein [Actinomycetota bacterium]